MKYKKINKNSFSLLMVFNINDIIKIIRIIFLSVFIIIIIIIKQN